MCGIVGKVFRNASYAWLDKERLDFALSKIQHRGPDNSGTFYSEQVWLGHVRLSILDLSAAGDQPMQTSSRDSVLAYNGETYNFKELSSHFGFADIKSNSDTEVVLKLLESEGVSALDKLNGMFAFAFYSQSLKKVWLARDRLGIKPLYYKVDPSGLSFSSEIKGIHALNGGSRSCDFSSVNEWAFYGTNLGNRTLLQGIKKVLPGHVLEIDLENFSISEYKYWSPAKYAGRTKSAVCKEKLITNTRTILTNAVKRQLVSDVPVGVFLSGGIDSSAITAIASEHYVGKLKTYSVGFDFQVDEYELPKARKLAKLYGTDHHELHIEGAEISDVVEKMVSQHDLPFSDAANIPLYLLTREIKGSTKVVLQGDGGDELFAGYRRYSTLSRYPLLGLLAKIGRSGIKFVPESAARYRWARYLNALAAKDIATVMALLLTEEDGKSEPANFLSADLYNKAKQYDPFIRYRECQKLVSNEDFVNQMLFIDLMIVLPDVFLEKVDRSTMASSVEVRVPFLDNDLVEHCLKIEGKKKVVGGEKKWLLKKALEGLVPHEILYGKKSGFGVPYGKWLKGPLKPLFFDHLSQFQGNHGAVIDNKRIGMLYDEHTNDQRDRSFLLWKILNFLIWANQHNISFPVKS